MEIYGLVLESNLGYTGNGEFGFDTVALGWQGSGGPNLTHQIVGGIADTDFFLGIFGLTPRPTNFTTFNDPKPSYLHNLKNQSQIPSESWGYTAGAYYSKWLNRRELTCTTNGMIGGASVYGSLTLGGYDESRFTPNNLSFSFSEDISKDLTVAVQSISMSQGGQSTSLLPKSINMFIDSTVPYIWLPLEACLQFEQAFGLTYDNTSNLYLINDTLHSTLVQRNASVIFTIANNIVGGPTTDIVLPYASFDLEASWPLIQNKTKYFPLQRAANETQYVLGRTFLQEAYVITDYERGNFTVSQAKFDQSKQLVVPIMPLGSNSTTSGSKTSSSLTGGAIAGIVVGAIAAIALVAFLVWFFIFRRRRNVHEPIEKDDDTPDETTGASEDKNRLGELEGDEMLQKSELDANGNIYLGSELDGKHMRPEIDGKTLPSPSPIFEVEGTTPYFARHELESSAGSTPTIGTPAAGTPSAGSEMGTGTMNSNRGGTERSAFSEPPPSRMRLDEKGLLRRREGGASPNPPRASRYRLVDGSSS